MSPKSTLIITDPADIERFKKKGFDMDFPLCQWLFDNYDLVRSAIGLAAFDMLGYNITTKPYRKNSLERGIFIGKSTYDEARNKKSVAPLKKTDRKIVAAICYAVRAALAVNKIAGPALPHNDVIPAGFEFAKDGDYEEFSLSR